MFFQGKLETPRLAILHIDLEGRVCAANGAARRLLGLAFAESAPERTARWYDRVTLLNEAGQECPADQCPVTAAALGDQPLEGALLGVRSAATDAVWCEVSAIPMFDPGTGRRGGAVLTLLDVTSRKQRDTALLQLANAVSGRIGGDFFDAMVRHLCDVLEADYAIVGEWCRGSPEHVQTVSVFGDGARRANCRYALKGTPCEGLLNRGLCLYPDQVAELFPGDTMLKDLGARGYVGSPLVDFSGAVLGLLVVLFRQPVPDTKMALRVLRGFAARASAELARQRAEVALRDSEARQRTLLEHAPEALILLDTRTGVLTDMNQNAIRLFEVDGSAVNRVRFTDFCPPFQADGQRSRILAQERCQQALNDQRPVFEWSLRTARGRQVPCEVRFVRFPDADRALVRGSLADITKRKETELERDRLIEGARSAQRRLQHLSHRLLEVQEEERRRIARELHDEVGQELTALKMNLSLARAKAGGADQPPAADSLAEASSQADRLLSMVREMSLHLRPTMLDDLGLLPALHWQVDRVGAARQWTVEFKHSDMEGRRFPSEIETAAYRIVQEALTNALRHAGPCRVSVRLWSTASALGVQVEDQGRGFPAEPVLSEGTTGGLSGMRERVSLLGGRFQLESQPGEGTRITAEFPIDKMPTRGERT